MVRLSNPQNYDLIGFEVNKGKKFKYDAILKNKKTAELRRIPFGGKYPDGTPYEHFKDQIGYYSKYDHNDEKRRTLYRKRHKGEEKHLYSSGYFSWFYLW